ncbi:hypothetical protein EIN_044360 [Entamoeba invadens IP1]|uniref:Uncharacterized protein n=1 Tax=Entamoeba invadens IP1 TaxID=370355 RepID=A0A0A1U2K9_ENTIV|nr:hypothetical protein EIN_044360 [Entamoeba invadens IP1]ELP86878.1 hypothetical protein EIN_044360 [Entamoeba invadens IP1]|eukprot:XP_004253649.1 hypothetical protein EIN_044360 [Entamoeba invadens IP1]
MFLQHRVRKTVSSPHTVIREPPSYLTMSNPNTPEIFCKSELSVNDAFGSGDDVFLVCSHSEVNTPRKIFIGRNRAKTYLGQETLNTDNFQVSPRTRMQSIVETKELKGLWKNESEQPIENLLQTSTLEPQKHPSPTQKQQSPRERFLRLGEMNNSLSRSMVEISTQLKILEEMSPKETDVEETEIVIPKRCCLGQRRQNHNDTSVKSAE